MAPWNSGERSRLARMMSCVTSAVYVIQHGSWGSGGRQPGSASTRKDRKSTRLNSSHSSISYAVFCLKKKKQKIQETLMIIKFAYKYAIIQIIWLSIVYDCHAIKQQIIKCRINSGITILLKQHNLSFI